MERAQTWRSAQYIRRTLWHMKDGLRQTMTATGILTWREAPGFWCSASLTQGIPWPVACGVGGAGERQGLSPAACGWCSPRAAPTGMSGKRWTLGPQHAHPWSGRRASHPSPPCWAPDAARTRPRGRPGAGRNEGKGMLAQKSLLIDRHSADLNL
jgi:hypothetical protein